jgi:putative transposase
MTDVSNLINKKELNELLKKYNKADDLFGKGGLIKSLVKNVIEAALESEMEQHLGYNKHSKADKIHDNKRNGYSSKTLKSDEGEVDLSIPRDRNGNFTPQILEKHQRRLSCLDDKIISLYSRGMSTRDIQAEIKDMYGTDVSPTLISHVTDSILDEVKAWQNRPLDMLYPIVFLDAIVVKIKEGRQIINKAVYIALGINTEGQKEVLGLWVSKNEGAKFWLSVLTDIQNRGVKDIFIACTDGLSGFPDAIEAVFPKTKIQLCIVHMVRNSTKFVSYKDRKKLCADLREIYTASTAEDAELALVSFGEKWDEQYPSITPLWQRNWHNLITFFDYPQAIRKVIYTTNAIESLNMTIRKVIKNKRIFPTDDSMFKQIYLALNNISKKWTMPIRDWNGAMNRFAIEFSDRMM